MTNITTILFDCDNTLVLSESLAFEACAGLANKILKAHNIDAPPYTGPALLSDFVGQNFRGMLLSLCKKFDFELEPAELESYVTAEEDEVIAKLKEKAQPCEGANEVLAQLAASGEYTMAVVSSSALRRVKASIEKVDQAQYFPPDAVYSAATSLPKPTSKPDPAIYLHAMKELGKEPAECVAVEDSKSGTLSAVRAGIKVIGYVGCYEGEEAEIMEKTLRDNGALVVIKHWREFMGCLKEVEGKTAAAL